MIGSGFARSIGRGRKDGREGGAPPTGGEILTEAEGDLGSAGGRRETRTRERSGRGAGRAWRRTQCS